VLTTPRRCPIFRPGDNELVSLAEAKNRPDCAAYDIVRNALMQL
jgi:hypothetical protein